MKNLQLTILLLTISLVGMSQSGVQNTIKDTQESRQGSIHAVTRHEVDTTSGLSIKGGNFDRLKIKYIPVIYTGEIPLCPFCQRGTERTKDDETLGVRGGYTYDEVGDIIKCNEITTFYKCLFCKKNYSVINNCKWSRYE